MCGLAGAGDWSLVKASSLLISFYAHCFSSAPPPFSPFLPRSAFHIIISYFLAKDRNPFVFSIQIGE